MPVCQNDYYIAIDLSSLHSVPGEKQAISRLYSAYIPLISRCYIGAAHMRFIPGIDTGDIAFHAVFDHFPGGVYLPYSQGLVRAKCAKLSLFASKKSHDRAADD